MSPPGCQKMWVKPCNRNAEESFPVLSLKSREQKAPNHLLIQDKDVLQPRFDLCGEGHCSCSQYESPSHCRSTLPLGTGRLASSTRRPSNVISHILPAGKRVQQREGSSYSFSNVSSSALASWRSAVSKPSVNQP